MPGSHQCLPTCCHGIRISGAASNAYNRYRCHAAYPSWLGIFPFREARNTSALWLLSAWISKRFVAKIFLLQPRSVRAFADNAYVSSTSMLRDVNSETLCTSTRYGRCTIKLFTNDFYILSFSFPPPVGIRTKLAIGDRVVVLQRDRRMMASSSSSRRSIKHSGAGCLPVLIPESRSNSFYCRQFLRIFSSTWCRKRLRCSA